MEKLKIIQGVASAKQKLQLDFEVPSAGDQIGVPKFAIGTIFMTKFPTNQNQLYVVSCCAIYASFLPSVVHFHRGKIMTEEPESL